MTAVLDWKVLPALAALIAVGCRSTWELDVEGQDCRNVVSIHVLVGPEEVLLATPEAKDLANLPKATREKLSYYVQYVASGASFPDWTVNPIKANSLVEVDPSGSGQTFELSISVNEDLSETQPPKMCVVVLEFNAEEIGARFKKRSFPSAELIAKKDGHLLVSQLTLTDAP